MKLTKILCVLSTVALLGAIGCKKDEKKGGDKAGSSAGKATGATKTPTTPPKTEPKKWTSADSLKAFNGCGEAFNAHSAEKMAACFGKTGSFAMVDWVGPGMSNTGGEAVMKEMADYFKAFPDVKGTPQLTLVNGAHVASISLDQGTNSGSMKGMPPSNKKISLFTAMLVKVSPDGTMASQRLLSDQATWSHQLGMFKSEQAPDSEKGWEKSVTVVATDAHKAKVDANVAVVKNFEAASAKKDMATIKAHITDDVSFRYVPMGTDISGAEAYMAGMTRWSGMFETMERDVQEVWGAGDWVVAVVENKGKIAMDIPNPKKAKTKGKDVKTTQVSFFKVVDSKVAAHWVFENSYSFATQAGMADPPPAMPAMDKGAMDKGAADKGGAVKKTDKK